MVCKGKRAIYAMVKHLSAFHSTVTLCKVLGVSRSGYYSWLNRKVSNREQQNKLLSADIADIFEKSRQTYGVPRIKKSLESQGKHLGKSRISRIMKQQGLKPKAARRFKVTTNSNHDKIVHPNILAQQFNPAGPNKAWASDITYIKTEEGWVYLATIIDLYSRSIIGWSMAEHMKTSLVIDALDMAIKNRNPGKGVIHHSDRGVQYCSDDYQFKLTQNGFLCSMSSTGNCYDNAVMESFYHSLKIELIYEVKHLTRESAKTAIFDYIEVFYNRQILHSTLGYKTPMQFEMAA